MRRIILSHCNVLSWFLICLYSIDAVQAMMQTTWDIDHYLKHIQELANQQLDNNEMCKRANIKNLVYKTEDNVIKVNFTLVDEKFKDCFKVFKISLEKKRRLIKEVAIPYFHYKQKFVFYRFENISSGIYEIFVQPCFTDRSCLMIKWSFSKSINITNKDHVSYSQNKNISDEKIKEKIIVISSIAALLVVTAIYELISYFYLSSKQKLKKVGDKTRVAEHEYVKINTSEDIKTEIKFICIYIFHSYDERNIVQNRVEALKKHLNLLLEYLFDIATLKCPLYSSIKTIDSELSKILFNVNDWLNDALNENVEDGCLQKIIWVGSEIEEEYEDSLENLIFSEFKHKMKNNINRCLYGYENLFVVRLHGIHAFSSELENVVSGSRYYIPSCLVDLCLDLCSGSGLVASEAKGELKILLQQHLENHFGAAQIV